MQPDPIGQPARRPRMCERHTGYHFLLRVRGMQRTFEQPEACGLSRDPSAPSADAESPAQRIESKKVTP